MTTSSKNDPALSAAEVRALALSLPACEEQDHFGSASFRVQGKIFAQLSADASHAILKFSIADQTALIATDPDTFSSVPHWGRFGWTRVSLAAISADFLRQLLTKSWRQIAPKKMLAAFDSQMN